MRTVGVGLLLLVLSIGCGPPTVLEVRDVDDARAVVHRVPVPPDGVLTFEFTHSIYGGRVTEDYRLTNGLRRMAVRTQTAGAADYYGHYGNVRRAEDGWIVDVAALDLDRLVIRVDDVGQPVLDVAGNRLALLELVPVGHRVELRLGGGQR
jgi:hypothetical protein